MELYWYSINSHFIGATYETNHLSFNFIQPSLKVLLRCDGYVSIKTDKIINEEDDEFLPTIAKLQNSSFCRDFEYWLAFHDVAQLKTLNKYYKKVPLNYMFNTTAKVKKLNKLFQCK